MSEQADGFQPDTKDWTWVLERPCPECGFDPGAVTRENLASRLAAGAVPWVERLAAPDAARRPSPVTWSPTEYAAHVRDMARVMAGRLTLLLTEDDPTFADWDQDAAAVEGGYAALPPAAVAQQTGPAVTALAQAYAAVPEGAWDRPGRRSNGAPFTVYTLGAYALHDLEHHLHDVAGAS